MLKERNITKDVMNWSVIDRWPTHPGTTILTTDRTLHYMNSLASGLVAAFTESVKAALAKFSESERSKVILLFSAHSLPLHVRMHAYLFDCAVD